MTFKFNNGELDATQMVDKDGFPEKPADPTRNGYDFDQWYTDMACKKPYLFSGDAYYSIKEPRTLYAGWRPKSSSTAYEVTYNFMYNYYGGSSSTSYSVVAGDRVPQIPNPARQAYTFDGWYKDSSCTQKWNFNDGVTSDMQLFAKWNAVNYDVTLNYNYTGAPKNDVTPVPQGAKVSEIVITGTDPFHPMRTGYLFAGWFTDAACTKPANFDYSITSNVTFYAKWTQDDATRLTAAFDYKGGSGVSSVFVSPNELLPKPNVKTAPAGTTYLEGWYTTSDFKYGTKWDFLKDRVTQNMTLYAKWVYPKTAGRVDFICEPYARNYSVDADKENKVPLQYDPVSSDPNMIFDGWYQEDYYRTKWDFSWQLSNSIIQIYAKWVPKETPASIEAFSVVAPDQQPSLTPQAAPSEAPAPAASIAPSVSPSEIPEAAPSQTPSVEPEGSIEPEVTPSQTPSVSPESSVEPETVHSQTPSVAPVSSVEPDAVPSQTTSIAPESSVKPEATPEVSPSAIPSPEQNTQAAPEPSFYEVLAINPIGMFLQTLFTIR